MNHVLCIQQGLINSEQKIQDLQTFIQTLEWKNMM